MSNDNDETVKIYLMAEEKYMRLETEKQKLKKEINELREKSEIRRGVREANSESNINGELSI